MELIQNMDFTYLHEEDINGYTNPLNPSLDTADPCIRYNPADGYYYGIYTGSETLVLHRTKELRDMLGTK